LEKWMSESKEAGKLMLVHTVDKEAWRSKISIIVIVEENISSDSGRSRSRAEAIASIVVYRLLYSYYII
jgi:hypothetical protein